MTARPADRRRRAATFRSAELACEEKTHPIGISKSLQTLRFTVTLATFMELLGTAVANVSLPHIAGGLHQALYTSRFPAWYF